MLEEINDSVQVYMAKDFDKIILEKGTCCICGRPMKDSCFISFAQLDKKASWKYPVWNNILIPDLEDRAIAVVCSGCHDATEKSGVGGRIKYAIELRGEELIMHDIDDLEDVPPLQTIVKPTDDPSEPITGSPYLFTGSADDSRYGLGQCHATYNHADLLETCRCCLMQGHTGNHQCDCGWEW